MFCDQALSQVSGQIQYLIDGDNDDDPPIDDAICYECSAHNCYICNDNNNCNLGSFSICIAGGDSNLGLSSIIGDDAVGDILSDIDLSINTNVFITHQQVQPEDHQYQSDSFNVKILWENGQQTDEPIKDFGKDTPVNCAIYKKLSNTTSGIIKVHDDQQDGIVHDNNSALDPVKA